MKCRTVYRFICEHLDDPTGSKRFSAIRQHLAKCVLCSKMLASLKTTADLYQVEPKAEVPTDTHRKLMKALEAEQKRGTMNDER